MSTVAISALTPATPANLTGAAIVPVTDSASTTVGATLAELRTALLTGGTGYATTDGLTVGGAGAAITGLQGTAKAGADQAAGAFTVIANLSTGAGTPGSIVFAGGQILGSSATVQTAATIWTMRMGTTTAISELVSGQATARIIGGSTNGIAFRNSGNARDNYLFADNGAAITLTSAVLSGQIGVATASGELPQSIRLVGADSITGAWITPNNAGTAGITAGFAYFNQTQFYAAVSIANVAAGFGTLSLMKSGGVVAIGNNTTGTADNLTLAGSAYGAGVASLRFNGLTTAATNNLVGTLTNSPVTGNPTFWLPVSIAGVIKYIPCF